MSEKNQVMIGAIIGSIIGGYVPVFFGIGMFSFTSVITTGIGGIIGLYVAYKLVNS